MLMAASLALRESSPKEPEVYPTGTST